MISDAMKGLQRRLADTPTDELLLDADVEAPMPLVG